MSAWGFAKLEKKLKIWTHGFYPYQKKRMTKKKIGGETEEKHKRDDT